MTRENLASAAEIQTYVDIDSSPSPWGDPAFIHLGSQVVIEGTYSAPSQKPQSGTPLELEVQEWLTTSRATLQSIDDYIDALPEDPEE